MQRIGAPQQQPCLHLVHESLKQDRSTQLRRSEAASFDGNDRLGLVHVTGVTRGKQTTRQLIDYRQRQRHFAN